MKVAVLTLRLHSNYGGILQAYALMTVLKRLGHEPYLVFNQNFKERNLFSRSSLYMRNILKKVLLGQKGLEVFRERRFRREYEVVCRQTMPFVLKYISPRTDTVCTPMDWKMLQDKYHFDAYIVGSDQVWRTSYTQDMPLFFFSFLKDDSVKRLSYAASFGTDEWSLTREQTARCASLVKKFAAVSVREKSAVDLCKNYLDVKAEWVLDPTLLLSKEDYLRLVSSKSGDEDSPSRLLVYLLDKSEEKERVVSHWERKTGLRRFYVNNPHTESGTHDLNERIAPPVEKWLEGFASARFVVTDSFHACVFSILFHIPFCVIGNPERGMARFHSLLSLFSLENRLVTPADGQAIDSLDFPAIDWDRVDLELSRLRQQSIDFLNTNLTKA